MFYTQLRAFHGVAENNGFTRAAAALNVTQPTLSSQVSALETDYSIKLVTRKGRGIELTALGQSLYAVTCRLFRAESDAKQLLSAASGLVGSELHIGADAPYQVTSVIAPFKQRYPGVLLSIGFGNSQQLHRELLDRKFDLVILPELEADERIHATGLGNHRLVVFVDRGHSWATRASIAIEEIADTCLILREKGSKTRAIFEQALQRHGVHPKEILEVGSREGVREAVAAGLGVGVVSENEFAQDSRLHGLTIRNVELFNRECVACLRDNRGNPALTAFFELLECQKPQDSAPALNTP
jgi:aminoethylphosphonate catabolism LysR family transcriptional regulator